MKLIINTAHLLAGGAVQVALSVINECKAFPENEYHVFVGRGLKPLINTDNYPSNYCFYFFDWNQMTYINLLRREKILKRMGNRIHPDCIVTTSGPSYFPSKAPQIIGYNLPVHIYLESPYFTLISKKDKIKLALKKIMHRYFFQRDGNAIFVQTDDLNNRVRKLMKSNNVYTITNTCSSFFKNPLCDYKILPDKEPDEIRLLTLTTYYLHKNLEIIPLIIDHLVAKGYNNVKFVLTLDNERFNRLIPLEYRSFVYNAGYVKPIVCPALYKECDIMFLPTLLECFSASYPEAMIMEKPIITTDIGFAHIVCKNSALYFKPMDAQSATECIIRIMNDKELKNRLIENGIRQLQTLDSPEQRAKKIMDLCKMVCNSQKSI
jgi:glycosyltransferase involved in cell wall biosynthesis